MSEPTNRERLEKLEKMVSSIYDLVTKDKPCVSMQQSRVVERVGSDEQTTTAFLLGDITRPMPLGEIPMDEKGNIIDPTWHVKVNEHGEKIGYVQIINGREVKQVLESEFKKNRDDFVDWQSKSRKFKMIQSAAEAAAAQRDRMIEEKKE